jgi:hypothetical protein
MVSAPLLWLAASANFSVSPFAKPEIESLKGLASAAESLPPVPMGSDLLRQENTIFPKSAILGGEAAMRCQGACARRTGMVS